MDRASATEKVNLGSILGRVKSKAVTIDINSLPAWRAAL